MSGANSVTSNQETLHKDLEEVVRKYARTTFLRPIADHTREAFAEVETFVEGFNINYGREFTATNKGEIVAAFENLNPDMAVAGKYGSITCVQVSVGINQPIWDFNSYSSVQGGERGMPNFNRVRYRTVELTYTYYVPCLHYQRVESEE